MEYDILLCGVGGQGVLSIAAVIASSALAEGFRVRQSEVHGMSQRGGGVHAHLRISDFPIASDLIPSGQADMILSMEPLESLRYLDWLKKDGVIITAKEPFVNIPDYPELKKVYAAIKQASAKAKIVDSANLAKEAGNARSENMVLVGAALENIPVSKKAVEDGIQARFAKKDPRLVEINVKAVELGELHK